MTYKDKYFEIINNGLKEKPQIGYYEHHHIVPKSICPLLKKSQDNLVYLTAQNHFLAHYYIWKWFKDELHDKKWSKKMCFAFNMMKRIISKSDNVEELSKLYEEVRKDLSEVVSEAMKGEKHHFYGMKGEKHPRYGKHHNEETKQKISQARKGNKSLLGKHHSKETRRKMSEAHKGRKTSEETRIKISNAHKGKKLSEDHKRKLSEALKGEKSPMYGKHPSIETRKKMSAVRKGRHQTEEQIKKRSEAMKKPILQFDKDGNFIRKFKSATDAGKELGIDHTNISRCCNGRRKSAGNFIWSYQEEKTEI